MTTFIFASEDTGEYARGCGVAGIDITEDDNDDNDVAGIGDGDDGDIRDHDPVCTSSIVTNWTV